MDDYRLIILDRHSATEFAENWISRWENFIESHPGASPFQVPGFFKIYLRSEKHFPYAFLATDKNDMAAGSLVVVIHREYRGIAGFLSSRAIITGDPVTGENDNAVLEFLLGEIRKQLSAKSVLIQFRNSSIQSEYRKEQFKKAGFRFDDHLNIILDLSKGPDGLWEDFSRSRKKGIRRAQSTPFEFKVYTSGESIEDFHSLLAESYSRIGLPYPGIDHFTEIFSNGAETGPRLFSLELEGEKILMMVAILYNKRVYGYYAGARESEKCRTLKPADLFYWEVLKWCSMNGMQSFDWMGAGKPGRKYGVRDFKLEFGGETINTGRYERVNHRLLFLLSKTGLYFYRKMKSLR